MSARIRTGYSFRSAVGRIDEVIARLKENGSQYAPITDTASTFGYVKWNKAARKAGLKPVFGVELAVTNSINEKKPAVDYWTFIAKDSLVPIHELIGLATSQFRIQPLLTLQQALERTDVFAIIGHRADFTKIQPREGLFFGLGPALSKGQLKRALEAGLAPIAVSDNRYPCEGGQGLYETICGRGASTQSYPQWIMSDEEWTNDCCDRLGESCPVEWALTYCEEIMEQSTATLQPAEMVHPERPTTLAKMCWDGAKRLGCDLGQPVYADRLQRELDLIKEKNFEDYFYLVADVCQWARGRMIVGPGRGSSGGSLVCYLLGITTVDPIPYGLIFERFIDINRTDMPDIDIDFPDHRRSEVFEYVSKKYGRERVAKLGTVMMYQPKSALKESAGAMDIAPWLLDPVRDSIIEYAPGDAKASQSVRDTLHNTSAGQTFVEKHPEIMIAADMEGHPRHAGKHAGGVVITDKPIIQYVAVDQRTGATMCDKRDAEELNLLKVDALGLAQLSIFEKALELAKLPRNHLFSLPLDDPKAFDVLNNGKTSGIAQFAGNALGGILRRVHVTCLDDLVAITSIARPGVADSGGAERWIRAKNGAKQNIHPLLEPILKDTYGVMVYQEQVMAICRTIGNLPWEDVSAIRKGIGKSMGAEFLDRYRDKFWVGAIANRLTADEASNLWAEIITNGSYGFNKSHAVAYSIISYWCCWLKAHFPLEFAAATLTFTDSPETQIKMLREMAVEGVKYIPADIDLSTTTWTVKKGGGWNHLVGPLSNVIGVGPKMMSKIMTYRDNKERGLSVEMPEKIRKLLENPKTKIDSLFPVEKAFKALVPESNIEKLIPQPKKIIDVQTNGQEYDVMVLACAEHIKLRNENEEALITKRQGKKIAGQTSFLNLRLADDTDTIFAKINRWDFERIGRQIVERGNAGKALYVVKGSVPRGFRMISVKAVKFVGEIT